MFTCTRSLAVLRSIPSASDWAPHHEAVLGDNEVCKRVKVFWYRIVILCKLLGGCIDDGRHTISITSTRRGLHLKNYKTWQWCDVIESIWHLEPPVMSSRLKGGVRLLCIGNLRGSRHWFWLMGSQNCWDTLDMESGADWGGGGDSYGEENKFNVMIGGIQGHVWLDYSKRPIDSWLEEVGRGRIVNKSEVVVMLIGDSVIGWLSLYVGHVQGVAHLSPHW